MSDARSSDDDPWYRRPEIVRQMPALVRLWAVYARLAEDPESHRVRGGSFLLRRLDGLSRACHSRRTAVIRVNGFEAAVRAYDVSAAAFMSDVCGRTRIHQSMQCILREGDTFLDVGANHGAYSLLASRLVGHNGRIVAVEPFAELADCLADSLARNAECRWSLLRTALGDIEGDREFLFDRCGSGSGSLYAWNASPHLSCCQVSCTTLDQVADWDEWPGHVLIKLDVEGAETAVLRGGAEGIRRHRPTILFEATPVTEHSGQALKTLLNVFSELGYCDFVDSRDLRTVCSAGQLDLTAPRDVLALAETGLNRLLAANDRAPETNPTADELISNA